jgi:hypothetical protein
METISKMMGHKSLLGIVNLIKEDLDDPSEILNNLKMLNLSANELDKTIRSINEKTQFHS